MPTFVVLICFASALLLIALGVPLWLRRVPPNRLYGVRFRSTLADDEIWYEINALAGRNLVSIGAAYLVLLSAATAFGPSWSLPARVGFPTVLLIVALIANTILLASASARLLTRHNPEHR